MRITCDDGVTGVGYTYTIGTGGSSVVALLRDHLAPKLIGRDPDCIEAIWKDLFFHTHATAVGAITSLSLAAIDTALWDLRCKRVGAAAVEGRRRRAARVPVYTTEGGWLHLSVEELVTQTRARQGAGLPGRQAQGRQAESRGGRRAARGGARSGGRRVRDHGRREPVLQRVRSHPPGARVRAVRPRVARGAAAGRGSGRPRRARRAHGDPDRGGRVDLSPGAFPGVPRSGARARSSRSTAPGSAASRRGSRWPTSRRRSTSSCARTS